MKKDPNELPHTYVKRFRAEKVKIIGCDDSIACSAFRKWLSADHPLFKKLIMGKNLTLHTFTLWQRSTHCGNEQKNKCRDHSLNIDDSAPKTFTKFTVPIGQILRKLKNEPWFELPPPMKGDLTELDQTKYCKFHQGPGHTTNSCLKRKHYLEELTREDWYDEYLDKPAARPT